MKWIDIKNWNHYKEWEKDKISKTLSIYNREMESKREGDVVDLHKMVDEGFVPHRWIKGEWVEERVDRMYDFSSMRPGGLSVAMIHPDGRTLYYGLHIANLPPGYISSNYMKTILWKGYEQGESN